MSASSFGTKSCVEIALFHAILPRGVGMAMRAASSICINRAESLRALVCGFLCLFLPAQTCAELRCPEPVVQVGVARTGAPLAHRFLIENDSAEPLEITRVEASCGCLTPTLPNRVLQPGEKASVLLEVNTLSQPAGPHTWALRLEYHGGSETHEISLELCAKLITEVMVQPAAVVLAADQAPHTEITLTDLREHALRITTVRTSSANSSAKLIGTSRDAQGHLVQKVLLQVAADCPGGRHEESLHLYTDDPGYPDISVPIMILKRARERISATPSEVSLAGSRGQPAVSRLVILRDSKGEPIKIDTITADDPAIHCRSAEGPGAMATVRISADPAGSTGSSIRSAVHIRLLQPAQSVIIVPVTIRIH
jgi:Protein of unknown function (DUF1573)